MATEDFTLTADLARLFLDYYSDTGAFIWRRRDLRWFQSPIGCRRWNAIYPGRQAGTITNQGYRQIAILQRPYRAARLAWLISHGRWPADQIDHINRNRSDDRLSNLREVSAQENQMNRKCLIAASGIKGVHWRERNKCWQVVIKARGESHYLGTYSCLEKAESVAQRFREEMHGEFACYI